VIEVDRPQIMAMVQTDSELSDILMRAFILRRLELIARGSSDVVLLGSPPFRGHAAHQGIPHPQRAAGLVHRSRAGRGGAGVPRPIPRRRRGSSPCSSAGAAPSSRTRATRDRGLPRLNAPIDHEHERDTIVVGGGSGGAGRGRLRRVRGPRRPRARVHGPGGQAARAPGSRTTRIPHGHLRPGAGGTRVQPGPEVRGPGDGGQGCAALRCAATALRDRARGRDDGARADHRHRHRRRPTGSSLSPDLARFEGAGVYYGATPMEAAALQGRGRRDRRRAGNSAGQAAVFLSTSVRRVSMLVRGAGLAETMSRYLIRRIEQSPQHRALDARGDRGASRARSPGGRASGATTRRWRSSATTSGTSS
jgi:thioredoxin reductase (NADPH)